MCVCGGGGGGGEDSRDRGIGKWRMENNERIGDRKQRRRQEGRGIGEESPSHLGVSEGTAEDREKNQLLAKGT